MSVLLSSKNGFELPNGDQLSTLTDQLAEFAATVNGVGSPTSKSSPISSNRLSPTHHLMAAQRMSHSTPELPNLTTTCSMSSSPSNGSQQTTTGHSLIPSHPNLDQLINSTMMDQHTPTDSGGDQMSNGSRSCSPSDPSDHRPTQLAAIANELLDQLNNLNRCTSPNFVANVACNKNRTSPSLSISDRSINKSQNSSSSSSSSSAVPSKSPQLNVSTAGRNPCNTVSLCNGQLQTQNSPLTTLSPPPSAQSPLNTLNDSSLRRLYHITHTQSMLHGGPLLQAFAQMRRQDMLLDCTLVCEQQMLRAHKLLLAACSPYFRTIFCSMAGCNNSAVVIPDVPALDLHCLLRIVYGELRGQLRLSDRRLLSIWRSARRLRMRNVCEFLLRNQMLLSNVGERFDQLNEQHLDQLQVQPAGAIADASLEEQNEMVDADEDMDLMQQLLRLDQNELLETGPSLDSSLHHEQQSPSDMSRFAQLDEMSATNSKPNSTTAVRNNSTSDSTMQSGEELNMISAIAVLSQAAAAAAAASGNSSNRRRFGVTDLPQMNRNPTENPQQCSSSSLDFMNSLTKDIEMSDVNGSSNSISNDQNVELMRRMQQALAATQTNLAVNMKQSNKSLSNVDNLFSQLTSGSLSPTTSALLLGLDLHQQQQTQQPQTVQQLSPGQSHNDLNGNSAASQLMAVAQQQLFGQLSGLTAAGFNVSGANAMQSNSLNNAVPVKRGRGRPPRHTQPRDLDDDPLQSANKDRLLHSPPQSDGCTDSSGPKRWRANMETILALKSRNNKLNNSVLGPNSIGLINSSISTNNSSNNNSNTNTITSTSAINNNGNLSKSLMNQSSIGNSAINQFDRLAGSLAASSGGTLPPVSNSTGNQLLMNGNQSSVMNGSSLKSIGGCKMANDRNGCNGAGPDNKNVCPFCPQVYYSNQAMNDHINNVHTKNSTKYTCEFCSKEFSWKISLTKHLKNCHNNNTLNDSNPSTISVNNNNSTSGLNLTSGVHSINSSSLNGHHHHHHHQQQHQQQQPTFAQQSSFQQLSQQMNHQLNKQLSQSLLQTNTLNNTTNTNGLNAQQLLQNNGELFKNLMGQQRDSGDNLVCFE